MSHVHALILLLPPWDLNKDTHTCRGILVSDVAAHRVTYHRRSENTEREPATCPQRGWEAVAPREVGQDVHPPPSAPCQGRSCCRPFTGGKWSRTWPGAGLALGAQRGVVSGDTDPKTHGEVRVW